MIKRKIIAVFVPTIILTAVGAICYVFFYNEPDRTGGRIKSNMELITDSRFVGTDMISNDSILRFDRVVADMGKIKIRQKKNAIFSFQNSSGSPAVITDIKSTCGCTSAEWDRLPLFPGQNSDITVWFEAEKEGIFFKKLFVHCSGASSPIEIAVRGEVR